MLTRPNRFHHSLFSSLPPFWSQNMDCTSACCCHLNRSIDPTYLDLSHSPDLTPLFLLLMPNCAIAVDVLFR
ncbi:hypothetical protein M408DRAFT_253446 [Serendipita vermifera MAFF 305830]|uniref:Uncharacterized protein n=1 Tax=Serendipita vermifera MAFF 305830 TaxID=933852 RepID=A0A0C2X2B1_SERVB|nr:hypothetical protein M408DRAFT_253446 [Serendipita vermifera MAFF 305830]